MHQFCEKYEHQDQDGHCRQYLFHGCFIGVCWTTSTIVQDPYNPILTDAQSVELGGANHVGFGTATHLFPWSCSLITMSTRTSIPNPFFLIHWGIKKKSKAAHHRLAVKTFVNILVALVLQCGIGFKTCLRYKQNNVVNRRNTFITHK